MKDFGRSAICAAANPDSATTGYPGAYQWYDAKRKLWRWLFVGSQAGELGRKSWVVTHPRTAEAHVREQAHSEDEAPLGARFRFAFIERWIRVSRKPKGWRPVIGYVVEVKKDSQRKRRRTERIWACENCGRKLRSAHHARNVEEFDGCPTCGAREVDTLWPDEIRELKRDWALRKNQ